LQGQGEERIEEIEGVQDEINTERIPDQLAMKWAGPEVEKGVFELPDVPGEGRFVEGPRCSAGESAAENGEHGPTEPQCEQRKDAQNQP
jgi:hypothetical protein